MVSDKVNFEWAFDEHHYKSCFARSVAVNSQFKQIKSEQEENNPQQQQLQHKSEPSSSGRPLLPVAVDENVVKFRKNSRGSLMMDDQQRRPSASSAASSRRTSFCSSRIAEIPIENIVHQSKVDSLQWQLRETEKSREMYKAVMKQVVTFLEKTHRSLELLSHRLNGKKTVSRSKSEHQIVAEEDANEDYTAFRDFTWRRPKKEEPTEEVPPEKLSQEAFRLLRTAQSLLNTQEPKLMSPDQPPDDLEFLAQLAKEFPPMPDVKRTTSFSMNPKLLTPERDTPPRISTAFNRKLSLQFSESRKTYTSTSSTSSTITKLNTNSYTRESFRESEVITKEQRRKSFNERTLLRNSLPQFKTESEKSNSPPAGSISSVEDESGFSSMNSFQDVGLPLISDEVTAKNVLLKSMLLHNNDQQQQQFNSFPNENHDKISNNNKLDDVKLWQKPTDISHKRWSSTPANYNNSNNNAQQMNVLWV